MGSLGAWPPGLAFLCPLWLTLKTEIAAVEMVVLAKFELKMTSLLTFGAGELKAGLKGQQDDSGLWSGMFKMGSL